MLDKEYDTAYESVKKDDGTFVRDQLIMELVGLIPDDSEAMERYKYKIAKERVDQQSKKGATKSDGQLFLPGLDPVDYEPDRTIFDNNGNGVPQKKASPPYMMDHTARVSKHAEDATRQAHIEITKTAAFNAWGFEEMKKGRPHQEVTFETFITETGVWQKKETKAKKKEPEPEPA